MLTEVDVTPKMIRAGHMYADPAFLNLKDHELAAIYRAMEAERRRVDGNAEAEPA